MTELTFSPRAGDISERLVSSTRFDWIITVLSAWMIGGLHLDAWAHHQFDVETFFTPWHGVLYSGFLALAAVLVAMFVLSLRQGPGRRQRTDRGWADDRHRSTDHPPLVSPVWKLHSDLYRFHIVNRGGPRKLATGACRHPRRVDSRWVAPLVAAHRR